MQSRVNKETPYYSSGSSSSSINECSSVNIFGQLLTTTKPDQLCLENVTPVASSAGKAHEKFLVVAGAVGELQQCQQVSQVGDKLIRDARVLSEARCIPAVPPVAKPPLYAVERSQLFKAEGCLEYLLDMLRESRGKLTNEIGHLIYLELSPAYVNKYEDYDYDETTSNFLESLSCYPCLFPKDASRILVEEFEHLIDRVYQDSRSSKPLTSTEMNEHRTQEFIGMRARRKFPKIDEQHTVAKEGEGGALERGFGVGGAGSREARAGKEEEEPPPPPPHAVEGLSDELLLASLFEEIKPFLKLGTLYKNTVPLANANVQRASAKVEGIWNGKTTVDRLCLRAEFEYPVLMQVTGRMCASAKASSSSSQQANLYLTISRDENVRLIELLRKQVHPCENLQFYECASICHIKNMRQVNCFQICKPKQHLKQPQGLEPGRRFEMSSLNAEKLCAEENRKPFFIFVSELQIYSKSDDASFDGKPSTTGGIAGEQGDNNNNNNNNNKQLFNIRLFPRILKHFGPDVYVLSFDDSYTSSKYEDLRRFLRY